VKLKRRPGAVIFDMDGVIVDSMPYHFIAWYEALRPFGVRINCFDVYSKEGEKWEISMREFLLRAHVRPTKKLLRAVFRSREKIFRKYFKQYIFKDAPEILGCLKENGYRLALVTGTSSGEIKKILPGKIRKYFEFLVAGDDVRKGKPFPDPYLKAAKLLKLPPSACVVVENAPYGIESAKRAGMFCVAVTTSLPARYLNKADAVVGSLKEVIALIDPACKIKHIV